MILDNILSDDDDDDLTKRLKNMIKYQAQRAYKETVIFNPIPGLGGYTQMRQMFDFTISCIKNYGGASRSNVLSCSYTFSIYNTKQR